MDDEDLGRHVREWNSNEQTMANNDPIRAMIMSMSQRSEKDKYNVFLAFVQYITVLYILNDGDLVFPQGQHRDPERPAPHVYVSVSTSLYAQARQENPVALSEPYLCP